MPSESLLEVDETLDSECLLPSLATWAGLGSTAGFGFTGGLAGFPSSLRDSDLLGVGSRCATGTTLSCSAGVVGSLEVEVVFLLRTGGGGRGMLGGGGMFRLRGLLTLCTLGLIRGAGTGCPSFGATTCDGWEGMAFATGDSTNTSSEVSSVTVGSLAAGTGGSTAIPVAGATFCGGGGGLRRGLDLWSMPVDRRCVGLDFAFEGFWGACGAAMVSDLGMAVGFRSASFPFLSLSSFSFLPLPSFLLSGFCEGGVRLDGYLDGGEETLGEDEGAAAAAGIVWVRTGGSVGVAGCCVGVVTRVDALGWVVTGLLALLDTLGEGELPPAAVEP